MALEMVLRRMKIGGVTVHGFRSAFRDWAAERTNFPAEGAELALAHTVSDKDSRRLQPLPPVRARPETSRRGPIQRPRGPQAPGRHFLLAAPAGVDLTALIGGLNADSRVLSAEANSNTSTLAANRVRISRTRTVSPSSGSVSKRKSSRPRRNTRNGAITRAFAVSSSASQI